MNIRLYHLLPRRFLSRMMFHLSRIKTRWLKNLIIRCYMRITGAKTDFAAEKDPLQYESLNAFFTRALAEGARPIDGRADVLVSPVDGRCAEYTNHITENTLLQAKNIIYSISDLLGSEEWAKRFEGGHATTLYLAPDDYHRIHMPCDGKLTAMRFCRGDKHSVSLALLNQIPQIFAGNERVVCWFETEFGEMAMVLVGALNVSSMSTVWHGDVLDNGQDNLYHYNNQSYRKGQEIARFNLGSTVILLTQKQAPHFQSALMESGDKVYLGQAITVAD
ncbi:MAG: archaetidylserine decarboxylase [Cardiobacteriaceae bacterium]|nr:archaetidylserine decarboxylase [Cardiobacteriaceae bacterium]